MKPLLVKEAFLFLDKEYPESQEYACHLNKSLEAKNLMTTFGHCTMFCPFAQCPEICSLQDNFYELKKAIIKKFPNLLLEEEEK